MMAVARWWAQPPGRVSFLADVDPRLLDVEVDPLPAGAPAIVRFRPIPSARVEFYVATFLDTLDRAAVVLFPRWLPGAEHIDGPTGLGVTAVCALAADAATRSDHFGPFLAATAERALRIRAGEDVAERVRFPAEVRARGLAGLLVSAYGTASAGVLIEVPDSLTTDGERALVAAAEWLAQNGRFAVWLVGPPLRCVDRISTVRVTLPSYLAGLTGELTEPPETTAGPAPPLLTYPPLSGVPRADSAAEQALERALAPHSWARGRLWNWLLEWHRLGRTYRLDLYWPDDGLVVEVDGDEHRGRWKYADDRRRDAQLQLLGHDVLRFTNEQVLTDPHATAITIRDLLQLRRARPRS